MHKNPWTYIIANCVVAVVSVLGAVAWPELISAAAVPYVIMALGVLNTIAHSITDAGPASGSAR
jgi:hypothetical protein